MDIDTNDLSLFAYILGDAYYKKYISSLNENSLFNFFIKQDIDKEIEEIKEIILNIDTNGI